MRYVLRRAARLTGLGSEFDDGATRAFALRLLVSFAATLALVGTAGYLYMDRQQRLSQIARYAAIQRSDSRTFESFGASARTPAEAIQNIHQVLDAISRQPGTLETLLIDRRGIIRASGDEEVVGTRDIDPRITA